MTAIRCLAVCLLWLSTSLAHCAPLILSDQTQSVPLGRHLQYLVDYELALTLEDVKQRSDFTDGHVDNLNFSFTQARVWLRFSLSNPQSRAHIRLLQIRYFLLDNITLYQPDATGTYLPIHRGRLPPETDPGNSSRFYLFELNVPAHTETEYYLAIDSQDTLALPIYLSTPSAYQNYLLADTIAITLYAGLILSNILFAIFMLTSLRERELLYYLLFLLAHHGMGIVTMEGIPSTLLGSKNIFLSRDMLASSISLSILFAVLFIRNFLQLKTRHRGLFRLSGYIAALLVFGSVQGLFLPHFYSIQITSIVCMFSGAAIGFIFYICVRQKQPAALSLLLGWSAGIVGATLYGLKAWGILPVNLFTSYAWHVGIMLETILFSYTIANKAASERKQRLIAQTELTHKERALRLAQEDLLRAEKEAKNEMEIRVRERTLDISRVLASLEHENKVLTELSINDGLTRVRNRRFFNDIYPQIWQDAIDKKQWLSLIMLDIDYFKAVNDEHGHLTGDRCLGSIAGILKKAVSRPNDIICRYGGEEFIIILPETDTESALSVAERIRKKISETHIETDHNIFSITASFGVIGIQPLAGIDPTQLIAHCDEALYRAKESGRNRVTLGTAPTVAHSGNARVFLKSVR